MAGYIPKNFISDLLGRLDIVDVIDSRIKLKKKGKNYSACCPFHMEKTPSFSVSQEKQFYHCFGCGANGSALNFVMEFDRLDFVSAIEELADSLGLEVPREAGNSTSNTHTLLINADRKRNLYELANDVAQFYQMELRKDSAQLAISYLKKRGLSGEIAKKFRIGFIDNQWDGVRKKFNYEQKLEDQLILIGILIENNNGSRYDRFRCRIMFPIRDVRGRVIGFGGRVLDDSQPKYLNSPETPIFRKGKELYGLYELLQEYREPPQILVVEGYMDVVALAQYGVNYAVASLGTSTTVDHMQVLFRYTSVVIFCFDGDHAGKEAAWRALENSLSYLTDGRQIKFMFLPDGEDPDSYIRINGKDAFISQLSQAMSLSDFMFSVATQQVDMTTKEGSAKLTTLIAPLIDKIPGKTLRLYLRDLLGSKLGIFDEHKLQQLIVKDHKTDTINKKTIEIKRTPMREVIALLLQNPHYAKSVPDLTHIKNLAVPGLDLLLDIVDKCLLSPNIKMGQLIEYWRGSAHELILARLVSWDILVVDDNHEEIFLDSLDRVLSQCIEKQIDNLQAKARSIGLSNSEKKELDALVQDLKA